jgi:hypothetical protein
MSQSLDQSISPGAGCRVLIANPRKLRAIYQHEQFGALHSQESGLQRAQPLQRTLPQGSEGRTTRGALPDDRSQCRGPRRAHGTNQSARGRDQFSGTKQVSSGDAAPANSRRGPHHRALFCFEDRGTRPASKMCATSAPTRAYVQNAIKVGRAIPPLRISKCGDAYLRRLLVSAAHYILGPFAPQSALRAYGLMLAEDGTARAKKRAVVAVARKLAVLLLSLWKHQRPYQPFPLAGSRLNLQQTKEDRRFGTIALHRLEAL